jgi:hypothetical protein
MDIIMPGQFDHIIRMITLSVITLSGFHYKSYFMVGAVKDPIAGATVSLGVSTGKTNRD